MLHEVKRLFNAEDAAGSVIWDRAAPPLPFKPAAATAAAEDSAGSISGAPSLPFIRAPGAIVSRGSRSVLAAPESPMSPAVVGLQLRPGRSRLSDGSAGSSRRSVSMAPSVRYVLDDASPVAPPMSWAPDRASTPGESSRYPLTAPGPTVSSRTVNLAVQVSHGAGSEPVPS